MDPKLLNARLEVLRTEHRDLDAAIEVLANSGASDQLSLWARDGLYVSFFDQTLTFQSLAKLALANSNYYTNF